MEGYTMEAGSTHMLSRWNPWMHLGVYQIFNMMGFHCRSQSPCCVMIFYEVYLYSGENTRHHARSSTLQ